MLAFLINTKLTLLTLSSFADDSGTLAKSKRYSAARRKLIGSKTQNKLER